MELRNEEEEEEAPAEKQFPPIYWRHGHFDAFFPYSFEVHWENFPAIFFSTLSLSLMSHHFGGGKKCLTTTSELYAHEISLFFIVEKKWIARIPAFDFRLSVASACINLMAWTQSYLCSILIWENQSYAVSGSEFAAIFLGHQLALHTSVNAKYIKANSISQMLLWMLPFSAQPRRTLNW